MTPRMAAALIAALALGAPAGSGAQTQDWLPSDDARGHLSAVSQIGRVQNRSNFNVAVDTATAPVRVRLLTVDPATQAVEAYTTELDFTRLPTFHTSELTAAPDSRDWAVLGIDDLRAIEDGCLRAEWVVYCGYPLAGQDWITLFHGDGVVSTYLLPAPDYRSFTVHHSTGTWSQTDAQHRTADARYRAMFEDLRAAVQQAGSQGRP